MRLFCRCLREKFTSPLTYIAAALFAVLCAFGPTFPIDEENYSFFDVVFNSELFSGAIQNPASSSYLMACKFSNSEWYAIGLAVLTAIPALYTYVKSIEKVQNFALIRSNYKSFSAGIVFAAFVTGFAITLAGFLIYCGIVYLIFPSFDSFADPIYQMMYGDAANRLFSLMKTLLNHAFVGGIIPVFAITLYRFIRSDFLAATIPMMIMYISVKVIPNYREWFSAVPERSQNPFLSVLGMLFPSSLTGMSTSLETSLNAPFWIAYIVLGAFLFAIYLLFYKSVKKV